MGAVIIKMMSSTSTTSTNGTILISESEFCVDLESCGLFQFYQGGRLGRPRKYNSWLFQLARSLPMKRYLSAERDHGYFAKNGYRKCPPESRRTSPPRWSRALRGSGARRPEGWRHRRCPARDRPKR